VATDPGAIHQQRLQKLGASPALKDDTPSSSSFTPKFLQKSMSRVSLPPTLSMTNAVSKDLARSLSVDRERTYTESSLTPPPDLLITPTSDLVPQGSLHCLNRIQTTPELKPIGISHDHISTSVPLPQSHSMLSKSPYEKVTRTQQKLLLQRASTEPEILPTISTNPLQPPPQIQVATTEYLSPSLPGFPLNVPFELKVKKEYDRLSKELKNVKRFSDPLKAALERLQNRLMLPSTSITIKSKLTAMKKNSGQRLSRSWSRSHDKLNAGLKMTRTSSEISGKAGGIRMTKSTSEMGTKLAQVKFNNKLQESLNRLWYDGPIVQGHGQNGDLVSNRIVNTPQTSHRQSVSHRQKRR
jgi:hypothetical protein